ncbi:ABC transporter ATP-binding protein [Longibaculum muris]|uniref:ABC transporter ATP-binding protein n=1 Tax=Longibaculum muris TaxID=1796628 RepID=UPI0022E2764C|nr:ABC transporter ATP-binding protein [Longibaculum muris]
MNAIEVRGISQSFLQKEVLNSISFEIQKGEIFGLLGPSGAGKTTLINIIIGQIKPNNGKTFVLGKNSLELSRKDYTQLGLVLDQLGLYERLSCMDNLQLYASLYQLEKSKIEEALKYVQLFDDRKKTVNELSKGMKQRLIIARAIMHHPQVLFLDEPTSGLDPATTLKIHELLLELKKQGTAIFLTTHNMEEASSLCDRVALLNEGHIIECDTPADICSRYNQLNTVTITTKDHHQYTIQNNKENAKVLFEEMQAENILSIHSSEPTLGSVFISLTGRELI